MYKIASLLLICSLVISCKNTSEKEIEIAKTEAASGEIMQHLSPYKFSLAQWSIHLPIRRGTMDAMDFAEIAKKLGFTGLEYVDQLYEIDKTIPYREWVMNLAKAWKEKSDATGMENVLIMIDRAGELVDPSAEKRKEAVERHKIWVDAAEYIGAPSLRVNLFGINEPEEWHKVSVISLKDLSGYAATKDIKILVENHAELSNDAGKLVAVIKEVNMPNCGTLPDFANFCVKREGGSRWGPAPCIEEYDPYKGIAELMPYAGGVSAKSHLFDENGDETEIDYYRMMQIVKDANFSGYIGIEHEDKVSDDPTKGILLTKALVIKALAQAK
jgi:sugar phosphate isomerase/epimerase